MHLSAIINSNYTSILTLSNVRGDGCFGLIPVPEQTGSERDMRIKVGGISKAHV
jgi:hypothetical protein